MPEIASGFPPSRERGPKPFVFVWESFGPMHADRCDAVAEHYAGQQEVIGLELAGSSDTYPWSPSQGTKFRKLTLFPNTTLTQVPFARRLVKLLKSAWSIGSANFFFCHYEAPEIFFTAFALRLGGRRVFVMIDSKFDDKPRRAWRELVKSFAFLPYDGALVAGRRTEEYLGLMRFRQDRIAHGYDTLSVDRVRKLAETAPAPDGLPFDSRHFTIIARFVAKKNLATAVDAYALYVRKTSNPRPLHLCGSGELEGVLREKVATLGLEDLVIFRGFLCEQEISRALACTLALLLISTEEQFGLVVIEAQAMGIPVIYTPSCGARDELLRSGLNGFLVRPDNPEGVAFFMELFASNQTLWRKFAEEALQTASRGDVPRFVVGVEQLCGLERC